MSSRKVFFHERNIKEVILQVGVGELIKEGERVAIKLHMGEEGNKTYIKPSIVKQVIDVVKSMKSKPFLIDSPTLYPRKRRTASGYLEVAKAHGFFDIGAEVIIGGGEYGEEAINVDLDRCFELKKVGVIKEIAEADAMIVLTHVKGHISAVYGGTLKQLGMGCVSTSTKRLVHEPSRPIVNPDTCIKCGACVRSCPFNQINMDDDLIVIKDDCTGCGRCINTCPTNSISRKEAWMERFYKRLMDSSRGVLKLFEKKGFPKVAYLNFLQDIYEFCDCSIDPGRRLSPDIGILASIGYPIPIELASIEFVRKFNSSAFPEVDRYIRMGSEIGLGDSSYELEVVEG